MLSVSVERHHHVGVAVEGSSEPHEQRRDQAGAFGGEAIKRQSEVSSDRLGARALARPAQQRGTNLDSAGCERSAGLIELGEHRFNGCKTVL